MRKTQKITLTFISLLLISPLKLSLSLPNTKTVANSRYQIECTMCSECDIPCNPYPSPPPPLPTAICPPPPSPPSSGAYYYSPPPPPPVQPSYTYSSPPPPNHGSGGSGGGYYYPTPPSHGGGGYYYSPDVQELPWATATEPDTSVLPVLLSYTSSIWVGLCNLKGP